ncbi:MAG: hypothetical protein Q4F67_00175 [Propionibacteriaceae bacterium]|nr:hypothetical protein [Propionibacteriaceae bacterium]
MTQATQSAPPATAPPRSAALPATTTIGQDRVADGRGIPEQLSRIRLASVVVMLAFAALTALQLILAGQALQAAAKDTAQLVRVQNIKVHLLRADALASSAFLVGGLESPEQRARYDESLGEVSRGITEAAEAQPLDREVLTALNEVVVDYAEGMANARATNRQGLPVGAGYLRASSDDIRDRGVVLVDALVQANTERAANSLGAHIPILMALPALAALIALGLMNQWIARRFRRRVNTGLAGAALAVLVAGIAAFALSATQAAANAGLRDNDYATAVNGAETRSAANAAKTNESLRLIARGSGQVHEDAWTEFSGQVDGALGHSELSGAPTQAWADYVEGHHEIVRLDNGGDWDGAVRLATDRTPGSPTGQFAEFDAGMQELINDAADVTSTTLLSGRPGFVVVTVLTVLGGLAGAGLAWRGVSARLKEYA